MFNALEPHLVVSLVAPILAAVAGSIVGKVAEVYLED
jgi:hypothetical protein